MRDIRFRYWDAKYFKMHYKVVVGNLHDEENYTAHGVYLKTGDTDYKIEPPGQWMNFDENCEGELMQYTGLKDKNGKEIYEGDIVLVYDEARVVKFKNAFWNLELYDNKQVGGFGTATTSGGHKPLYRYPQDWIEVIGNIYENSELLKAQVKEE